MVNFIRRDSNRYSKLGMRRKKKVRWKKPTGRDNKMREKRRGYPQVVSLGYKSDKKKIEKIDGKKPVRIETLKDLEKIKKSEIGVLGRVGVKKKLEIAKRAKEMDVKICNLNPKIYLKKTKEKGKKEIKKDVKEKKK